MAPYMVSLAAIRLDERAFWRVDGLAAILAGSSINHGPVRHLPDPPSGP